MQAVGNITPNFTWSEMLYSLTAEGFKKVANKAGISAALKAEMLKRYDAQYNPTDSVMGNIVSLCKNTLQPIANHADDMYGVESFIKVRSGYRSPAVNDAVKGASKSQHLQGEAADIDLFVDGEERNDLLVKCLQDMHAKGLLKFDQLILEHGPSPLNPSWVHISYDATRLRGSVLRKIAGQPYVTYNLFK